MKQSESAEMAGGAAAGAKGKIYGYNLDMQVRLEKAMVRIAEWVEHESGMFIGHVKMCVSDGGDGVTSNLVDIGLGVERHGMMNPRKEADFTIMAAVTDVDSHDLQHEIYHALDDSGAILKLDGAEYEEHRDGHKGHSHKHHEHHEHGENCGCGEYKHNHKHHKHGENCGCGEHKHNHKHHKHHEHGENCGCGEHKHSHKHHEHGEGCGCGEHKHSHKHHEHGENCGCGEHKHNHKHHEHGEGCGCGERRQKGLRGLFRKK